MKGTDLYKKKRNFLDGIPFKWRGVTWKFHPHPIEHVQESAGTIESIDYKFQMQVIAISANFIWVKGYAPRISKMLIFNYLLPKHKYVKSAGIALSEMYGL